MNSFGFIREGCRVLGAKFKTDDPELFDDLVEYEPTVLDTFRELYSGIHTSS